MTCPIPTEKTTPIEGETCIASKIMRSDSESGANSLEDASMAFALTQTAQCCKEVPQIRL